MSTITPVQFPRVDSDVLKQNASVPDYTPAQRKATRPLDPEPDRVRTGTVPAKAAPAKNIVGASDGQAADETKTGGVRFYNPRSVKVKNVPELGKHIDVRV